MRLPMEQHPQRSTRVTHASLKNFASVKLQEKKCCLYETPYTAAPIRVLGDVIAKSYALRTTSYRRTYKSQNSFFWFTSDAFCKRPVSSYQDSYVKFL